jgi:hypothetical protein
MNAKSSLPGAEISQPDNGNDRCRLDIYSIPDLISHLNPIPPEEGKTE